MVGRGRRYGGRAKAAEVQAEESEGQEREPIPADPDALGKEIVAQARKVREAKKEKERLAAELPEATKAEKAALSRLLELILDAETGQKHFEFRDTAAPTKGQATPGRATAPVFCAEVKGMPCEVATVAAGEWKARVGGRILKDVYRSADAAQAGAAYDAGWQEGDPKPEWKPAQDAALLLTTFGSKIEPDAAKPRGRKKREPVAA